ncbi:MAG: DEAD/DEAH box helicase [Parachlamydiales bacterium]|jgi:superfamily II DNA or RNA helicase
MSGPSLAYILIDIPCPDDTQSYLQFGLTDDLGKVRPLTPAELTQINKFAVMTADKLVLEWLRKNAPDCLLKGHFLPLDSALLRLIAATAKFFFRGKRLLCDFFSKNSFIYSVSKESEARWQLTAKIREKDKLFPLSECEALRNGNPTCYIRHGQLKFIENTTPWRHIKALYTSKSIIIDDNWKEYLTTLKDEPCLELIDTTFFSMHDPIPFLVLTDRTGAFASLKMDYGPGKIISYVRGQHFPQNQPFRVPRAEKHWETDLLETDFFWKPTGTSQYYCPLDKVNKSLTFLLEMGWKIVDAHGNLLKLCQNSSLALDESPTHISLQGSLNYGTYKANLKDALGSFNRRDRFIPLGTGEIGLLPDSLQNLDPSTLLTEGEWVADELQFSKNKAGLLAPLFEQTENFQASDKLKAFCQGKMEQNCLEPVSVSTNFIGALRPYQQIGVDWLMFLYNTDLHGLLADDMGLGKTVQVIAFLASLPQQTYPSLIVVPTSLLANWQKELARFYPKATVYLHHGAQRTSEEWDKDIIITTYATLRLDGSQFLKQRFHCLLLDESHLIKNAYTQTAQAAYSIKADFRLSITGTPIENNLNELWSQFHFLMPGLLQSQEKFRSEIESGTVDPRFLARIRRQIKPFVLRRTKKEVAPELPEKIEQTVWIEMSPEQRQLYDTFLSGARQNILSKVQLEGTSKHRLEILEILLRLRQICCDPRLVAAQHEEAASIPSAKLEAIIEDLTTLANENAKVLVYSQFTKLLQLVGKELKNQGMDYFYLDGQTNNRADIVEKFQTCASPSFFLISLKAGGVGLNLTAADYVLLLDPWWNEAAEQQAIDRAHRIGRQEPVIAKRYVVLDTIEEKIMKLKAEKQRLAGDLFEASPADMQISFTDLELLLSI